jgi:CRP-like cAMP-binding protein
MGARLHAIREACNLEPESRSEENTNDILDFVKDVKFFARLSVLQQKALCRTMSLEEFGPREFIFQMGEMGDKFYIILQGSVGVQVPSQTAPCPNDIHAEKCDCSNRPLETVVFLEKGMGFGELALQSDQPRSATIQTSEKTELLVTKRTDYEMYAGQLHRQFIEQRVKFLRQCPRIEDALQKGLVSTQDIAAMANCLNEVNLAGNAAACRQGDPVENMIFVRSGQLATLRCVDLEQSRVDAASRAAAATRASFQHRMTLGGQSNPAPAEEAMKRLSEGMPPQGNRQMFAQNLAKAMMEMKKKDRNEKLQTIETKEKEAKEAGNDEHSIYGNGGIMSQDLVAHLHRLGKGLGPDASKQQGGKGGSEESTRRKVTLNVESNASPETQPETPKSARGHQLWMKLKASVATATSLTRFVDGATSKSEPEKGNDSKAKSANTATQAVKKRLSSSRIGEALKVVASVPPARNSSKQPSQQSSKFSRLELDDKSPPKSPPRVRSARGRWSQRDPVKADCGQQKKRVRILRIGTLGPYQYFGDQQVCGSDPYPVSLVSDPVAEIYVMSKHDILRRVPKKLFSALFTPEKEAVPSDSQLLEMHKQTERWNGFRRSMHGEILGNLKARNQFCGGAMALRGPSSESRIDALANLEFLGVNPYSDLAQSLLPLPQNKGVALTPKDEELFSQASAWFLRRFDINKRDPGLRRSLASAGLMRQKRMHDDQPSRLRDGLPGSALDDDDPDPMAFRFDQHWYKLQKDPIGLDLDDVLSEDTLKASPNPASSQASSNAPSRASISRGLTRGSLVGSDGKRSSLNGGGMIDMERQLSGGSGNWTGMSTLSTTAGGDWPSLSRSSYSNVSGSGPQALPRRKSMRHDTGSELPHLSDAVTPRDKLSMTQPLSSASSMGRKQVGFNDTF